MKFLSIQSSVAYGHAGNSAAMFPLQRIGVEVMPVYTVSFSNHTGYGAWRGKTFSGDDIREIVLGIDERGGLDDVDVVLSGYLGSADIGRGVLDAVQRVKERSPSAIYACDPVMGNVDTGCVVKPEVQDLFRDQIIHAADLITPNHFELGYLTGTHPSTLESTLESVDAVFERGPSTVLVTSLHRPEAPPETVEMLAATRNEGAWLVQTPRLAFNETGSGDLTAALFSAHFRRTKSAAQALQLTTASVYDVLDQTVRLGGGELKLVASQDLLVHPRSEFAAQQVR